MFEDSSGRTDGLPTLEPRAVPEVREPILRFRRVEKRFGGTLAVAGVDLDVLPGEIHALLGANGAGKSTLIKLLAGVHDPDSGEIYLKGQRIDTMHPRPPMAFIHQDLGLVDWMTVAENVALAKGYSRRWGLINWNGVRASARTALQALDADIDCDKPVGEFPRTERSIIAIVRALALETDVLILDEPTASLPESETRRLFAVLERLRSRGVGIVYVTHRLDEVFRIADRVTVMRDGRKVLTERTESLTPDDLVFAIVGRRPAEVFMEPPRPSAAVVLAANGLRSGKVGPVTFSVAAGEIVALVGLLGSGQNTVGRALAGIDPVDEGTISLGGQRVDIADPADAVGNGVFFVTSNRETESLATNLTVTENIFLNPGTRGHPTWRPRLRRDEIVDADEIVRRFSIRPSNPRTLISTLSGGNQQKTVLARWLNVGARVLVLEEPTMGVAVGAKAEIYDMLQAELTRGAAVVLVSSDLEEVARISTRALVFNRGRITRELSRNELTTTELTAVVGGAERGEASR